MPRGKIASVVSEKGFGFIKPNDGGEDLFFHGSSIDQSFDALAVGQEVEFEVDQSAAKPRANRVKIHGELIRKRPGRASAPRGGGRGKFERGKPAGGRGRPDRKTPNKRGDDRRSARPKPMPVVVENGEAGTIASVRAEKGFGFIKPDAGGEDLFFHSSAIGCLLESLVPGQQVEFEIDASADKPRAGKVALRGEILKKEPRPDAGRSARPGRAPVVIENGQKGTVASIMVDKGFGFIKPVDGGEELFFHNSVTDRPLDQLVSGQDVEFEVDQAAEKPRALKVAVRGEILTKSALHAQREPTVVENGRPGEIVSLVIEKGFGFVRPRDGGDDLFFHNSTVDYPFELLVEGQRVEFSIDELADKPRAKQVAVRGEILENAAARRNVQQYPRAKFEMGFVTKMLWKDRQGFISPDTGGAELLFGQKDVRGDKLYTAMQIGDYVQFVRTGEVVRTKIDKAPTATAVQVIEKEIKRIPTKELPNNPKSRRKKPTWRR